jgi:predicted transcriptional regulator
MKISKMQEILAAEVLCGDEFLGRHVYSACGSDLMSDVLAFAKDQAVLITGLVNPQVVRTALMMDMNCIVFVRAKKPGDDIIRLAKEHELVVLSTEKPLYTSCGLLYANGLLGSKEVKK